MANMVRLGEKWVGNGQPCFIIAEAGSNHDGKLEQAMQLIDGAASAGADAVKFQLFRADRTYPRNAGKTAYLKSSKSVYDLLNELEMPYEWLPKIAEYCKGRGILFLASVFDEESADRAAPFVACLKIASYEMTHIPLVRYVGEKGRPVVMSTGAADMEEVVEAVAEFRRTGNSNLILMQCTAAYPAPLEALNIRTIPTMKSRFQVPVGLSDHSTDPTLAPLLAVAVGANVIEKHFTLSRDLPGPDHRFAIEPTELHRLVTEVRAAESALGTYEKRAEMAETELRRFARRTIVAIREIQPGETFTRENIAVLRAGILPIGLQPKAFPSVLGKRASKLIPAYSTIHESEVA